MAWDLILSAPRANSLFSVTLCTCTHANVSSQTITSNPNQNKISNLEPEPLTLFKSLCRPKKRPFGGLQIRFRVHRFVSVPNLVQHNERVVTGRRQKSHYCYAYATILIIVIIWMLKLSTITIRDNMLLHVNLWRIMSEKTHQHPYATILIIIVLISQLTLCSSELRTNIMLG